MAVTAIVTVGPPRGAAESAAASKIQKQFAKLIERVRSQREDLVRWRAFKRGYDQQLIEQYEPLARRIWEKRAAMAKLLDRALQSDVLSRRECLEVRESLSRLVADLLTESEDSELVRLHDKYAVMTFDEEKQNRLDALRTLAGEEFGVDVEAYEGAESPEEFADWLEDQARAGGARSEPLPRPKNAKAEAREALQERVAAGGTQTVREVFRKLASELHPDREPDPLEQKRKTEIMQRVNQAYKSGDLLTLLELQFSGDAVMGSALAGVDKEKRRYYLHVLETQSARLREEFDALIAPFLLSANGAKKGKLTPAMVQKAFEADIRELKRTLRNLDSDLLRFRDFRELKYGLGPR